ncbi:hypothetical protein V494_05658 [Pseudogymnoascus sp. VKM F-4513 (FW-928)]|nr:hypothetical protein V494_05658 [Pseudogymnoascus sp. VKM F-4513 (FW-928)]
MDLITSRLGQAGFTDVDCEPALKDFARSDEVTDLCSTPGQEIFARARNARLIMSDVVPGRELMSNKESYPYCIWHPGVASEDTYRKLAATYPDMRYQVGRACAVAGYAQLYHELNLLPDPCIAEEAREASRDNDGSRHIFEQIMAAPVRYSVFNDYDLTIALDSPKPGAFLNADTAVVATLKERKKYQRYFQSKGYFNITEDLGIGLKGVRIKPAILTDDETDLLVSPLPFDLPTMNKDLLILASAYEGNVDRYARLRRKGRSVKYEVQCLVPGLYRSTAMAFWLDRNPDIMHEVAEFWDEDFIIDLRKGIHARHIMNNATHHLLDADPPVPDEELPYWIWYPTMPSSYTLCKLAEARAAMRPQCARACIAGGYREAYTKIMDMPYPEANMPVDPYEPLVPLPADGYLIREAETTIYRDFFLEDMKRRREEQGLKPQRPLHDRWKGLSPFDCADNSSDVLYGSLPDHGRCMVQEASLEHSMWGPFDAAELGNVRLYLSNRGSTNRVPQGSNIILR